MARLPIPGKDNGKWGDILNTYLGQTLDSSGHLRPNTVGGDQLIEGAVSTIHIAPGAITKSDVGLNAVDNTADVDKPISTAVSTALDAKVSISALDALAATHIENSASETAGALRATLNSIPTPRQHPEGLLACTTPQHSRMTTNRSGQNSGTYRTKHRSTAAVSSLKLWYGNWLAGALGNDTDGAAELTVRCSVESPDGTVFARGYTQDGKTTATIAPGGIAVFEVPINIDEGQNFYVRSYVAGSSWPTTTVRMNQGLQYGFDILDRVASSDNGEGFNGPNGADLTGTGSAMPTPTTSLGGAFVPELILGRPRVKSNAKSVIGFAGDAQIATADLGVIGFCSTAASKHNLGYIDMSRNNEKASDFLLASNRVRRTVQHLEQITHLIAGWGQYDIRAGKNLQTVKAENIAAWKFAARHEIKVYALTLWPWDVTSSDNFITLGNQTKPSSDMLRVGFNDWLRNGAPIDQDGVPVAIGDNSGGTVRSGDDGHPLAGYFDFADLCESTRNSGLWRVDRVRDIAVTVTSTSSPTSTVIEHAPGDVLLDDFGWGLVIPGLGSGGSAFRPQISVPLLTSESTIVNQAAASTGTNIASKIGLPSYGGVAPHAGIHQLAVDQLLDDFLLSIK